ncbi:hypothetical protein ACLB2K_045379 [Fragaria x ananassa]
MLMSEVENQEGVTSFGQALANSLMVASNTGDFGVEISLEKLFLAQKLAKAEGLPRDSDVTLHQINTNMIQIMILMLGCSKELRVHHFLDLPSTSCDATPGPKQLRFLHLALAKAHQLLLDQQERDYIISLVSAAKALAKAHQLLLDQQERDYIISLVSAAKGKI